MMNEIWKNNYTWLLGVVRQTLLMEAHVGSLLGLTT
jgi:hypothetical protein